MTKIGNYLNKIKGTRLYYFITERGHYAEQHRQEVELERDLAARLGFQTNDLQAHLADDAKNRGFFLTLRNILFKEPPHIVAYRSLVQQQDIKPDSQSKQRPIE